MPSSSSSSSTLSVGLVCLRRHRSWALALLVAILASVAPAAPAAAVDLPDGCYKTNAKIYWSTVFEFPADLKTQAQTGANFWESKRNWQGTGGAVNVQHDGTRWSHTVEADWSWATDEDGWGYGVCSLGYFVINSGKEAEWRNNLGKFRSVVAHELGHVIGLSHVGDSDSFDGTVPVMATCRGSTTFSQDDAAGANALSNRSGNYFNATANSSFENGSTYWGRSNTSLTSYSSGGVDGSKRYISMTSSGTSSYIYSTTRIADNQGHTLDELSARANYRRNYPYDSGYVIVVMRAGKYNYPNGETCGWPDFTGHDGAEADINAGNRNTSWTWWYQKSCYPGTGWGYCTAWGPNPSGADVFDARVYVYNRMRSPQGSYTSVALDRVRIMADF